MNPHNFTPKLFIGVGATAAYFTLRETFLLPSTFQGQTIYILKTFHHFNLSQNADEALAKAKEFSEKNGIPLEARKETMESEMREIIKLSREELEARQKREKENEERIEQARLEYLEYQESLIDEGKYPFGRYFDLPFNEAPYSYVSWVMNQDFEDNEIFPKLQKAIVEKAPEMILPEPDKDLYVGEIKKRQEFNVQILKNIPVETMYGWVSFVTMIDLDSKACLMSKGAFSAKVGDKMKIKATVKAHSNYKEQNQTVIQRIAKVEK